MNRLGSGVLAPPVERGAPRPPLLCSGGGAGLTDATSNCGRSSEGWLHPAPQANMIRIVLATMLICLHRLGNSRAARRVL